MTFESNARYDGYTHSASTALSTDFSNIKPVHVQAAFREIDDALRLNGAANSDTASALSHLKRAADDYLRAIRGH